MVSFSKLPGIVAFCVVALATTLSSAAPVPGIGQAGAAGAPEPGNGQAGTAWAPPDDAYGLEKILHQWLSNLTPCQCSPIRNINRLLQGAQAGNAGSG